MNMPGFHLTCVMCGCYGYSGRNCLRNPKASPQSRLEKASQKLCNLIDCQISWKNNVNLHQIWKLPRVI